jgi:hypothetical protein
VAAPRQIQLEDDPRFHRRNWRVQRFGWAVMAVVLLAALAGGLGRGPLSWASARSAGGTIEVEYDRVLRHAAPSTLRVTFTPASAGPAASLRLPRQFVEDAVLQSILPAPARAWSDGRYLTYEFALAQRTPLTVVFDFQPDGYNWLHGEVAQPGGEAVRFRQFILP